MEIEVIPCEMEVETFARHFPNLGVIETKLSKNIVDNLWKLLEESKKQPDDMRENLAGNISKSLRLDSRSPLLDEFTKKVLPALIDKTLDEFGSDWNAFRGMPAGKVSEEVSWNLESMWVNFQNKHEFNPPHDHSGIYSFVIWMQIPTSFKEQRKLPIAAKSNSDQLISNFAFQYVDILGNICSFPIEMEKSREGCMFLFPSMLNHLVFPFYENDGERISISGNIDI